MQTDYTDSIRSGFSLRHNLEVVKFQELLKKPDLFADPSRLQPRQ